MNEPWEGILSSEKIAEIEADVQRYRRGRFNAAMRLAEKEAQRLHPTKPGHRDTCKRLAALVVNDRKSLEEIATFEKRKKPYIARDIVFGACILRETSPDAMRLWELHGQPGIGPIKAISQYLAREN